MDQETFNQMLKKALENNITVNIKTESDIYKQSPDMQTITLSYDDVVIAKVVLNPLY